MRKVVGRQCKDPCKKELPSNAVNSLHWSCKSPAGIPAEAFCIQARWSHQAHCLPMVKRDHGCPCCRAPHYSLLWTDLGSWGTQQIIYKDKNVQFLSLHGYITRRFTFYHFAWFHPRVIGYLFSWVVSLYLQHRKKKLKKMEIELELRDNVERSYD